MTQPLNEQNPWQGNWDRIIAATRAVSERLQRCTQLFHDAGIGYALVGGRATMAWIDSVEPGASRNTPNVDFLVNRADLFRITQTLLQDKWTHREPAGWHVFIESENVSSYGGVKLIFANEQFRSGELLPAPSIEESRIIECCRVIDLEPLVRMKLTAFRRIDRVHLDDLLSVQLFDPSWTNRFPPEFTSRLVQVFDAHEVWPDVYVDALAAAGFQSDQELVEFQQRCRQSDSHKLNTLPWFLARENAHEKVRVA